LNWAIRNGRGVQSISARLAECVRPVGQSVQVCTNNSRARDRLLKARAEAQKQIEQIDRELSTKPERPAESEEKKPRQVTAATMKTAMIAAVIEHKNQGEPGGNTSSSVRTWPCAT